MHLLSEDTKVKSDTMVSITRAVVRSHRVRTESGYVVGGMYFMSFFCASVSGTERDSTARYDLCLWYTHREGVARNDKSTILY